VRKGSKKNGKGSKKNGKGSLTTTCQRLQKGSKKNGEVVSLRKETNYVVEILWRVFVMER
jgi:hypothetical protein